MKRVSAFFSLCFFVLSACASGVADETAVQRQTIALTDYSALEGQTFAVRLLTHESTENGIGTVSITEETLTLQSIETSDGLEVAKVTVDGETLTFSPTDDTVTLDGQIYRVYSALEGTYSALVGFQSDETYRGLSKIDGVGIVGHQTPLTALPTAGNAIYSGDFSIVGSGTRNRRYFSDFVLVGDVEMLVNFDTATLSGTVDNGVATLNTRSGRYYDTFTGDISETTFENGRFETSVSTNCDQDVNCDFINSRIEGGFYGPSGEEIAATISFDQTVEELDDNMDVLQYVGVGGIVAVKD